MGMTGQAGYRAIDWSAFGVFGMRLVPSLVAALVYAVYFLIWQFHHALYVPLLEWFDSTPGAVPFGDLGATLTAIACWRQGANVLVPNACMHGGMFNYSPLLLHAGIFGLSPAMTMPAGFLSGLVFIAACAFLPAPASRLELGLRCLAVCSCAVTHALETANIDALIFVLCVAGLRLVQRGGFLTLAGYGLFMLGGAIKFYPAALLVLILRERRPVFLASMACIAAGGAVFLLKFGSALATVLNDLPAGLPFAGVFGAMNMPFGFALLAFLPSLTLSPNVPQFFAAVDHPYVAQYIVICSRLLVAAGLVSGLQLMPRYQPWVSQLAPGRLPFLIGGAALICFCFDLTGNFDYRGVLLLLPLAALGGAPDHAIARPLQGVILFLLWDRFLRHLTQTLAVALLGAKYAVYPEIALWLARDYLWWWLVVRFTAILFAFAHLRLPALLPAWPAART
jgi:hypothetical protein